MRNFFKLRGVFHWEILFPDGFSSVLNQKLILGKQRWQEALSFKVFTLTPSLCEKVAPEMAEGVHVWRRDIARSRAFFQMFSE